MPTPRNIMWTPALRKKLRLAYNKAVKGKVDTFTLDIPGEEPAEFVTAYAKYLLEYLSSVLK